MEDNDNSFTISGDEFEAQGGVLKVDNLFIEAPIKIKLYKCRKCGFVCQAIGIWFHKNPEVGIERDYKFCYVCWLNMHKEHCGEVDEVTDEKET